MPPALPRRTRRLVVLFLILVTAALTRWLVKPSNTPTQRPNTSIPATQNRSSLSDQQTQAYLQLEATERGFDESLWQPEHLAQIHEDVFITLWDSLNHSPHALVTLAEFPVPSILLPLTNQIESLPLQITRASAALPSSPTLAAPSGSTPTLTPTHSSNSISTPGAPLSPSGMNATGTLASVPGATWRSALLQLHQQGWILARSSWLHIRFTPPSPTTPAVSVFQATAKLAHPTTSRRTSFSATFHVRWKSSPSPEVPPAIDGIEVSQWSSLDRSGPSPFSVSFTLPLSASRQRGFSDPLLAHDLDHDGLSEFLLPGAGLLLRNRRGQLTPEPLGFSSSGQIVAAVVLDWNHDGSPDLLIANNAGLSWLENSGTGRFLTPARTLWSSPTPLRHPQVITAGDIDGDGDLDLWLAQYKLPYQGGQFPTPYYDANDGFASFLLRNDGQTGLTDITPLSGLNAKRFRRTYSASFADLDDNGSLDLVNVSDFAGLDLYHNNGKGTFVDHTAPLNHHRHLFGMAHALADLNLDSQIDLLAIGMTSPTASRLLSLGLHRPGLAQDPSKQAAMTEGNRLFINTSKGLAQTEFGTNLAQSGWAWGVSVLDVNSDGQPDVAIANGHETLPSTQDYERQFWLHDIHVASSSNNPVLNLYFGGVNARRAANRASYGGWQDNSLFLNLGNGRFEDVAFVAGFTVPEDSQNLIADDLNGDGQSDLVTLSFGPWPDRIQTLRVFQNYTPSTNHWIGLRLDDSARNWPGCRIQLTTDHSSQTRWLVTGDSYRSQHAPAALFHLPPQSSIQRLEILWPDKAKTRFPSPSPNRWHSLPKQP